MSLRKLLHLFSILLCCALMLLVSGGISLSKVDIEVRLSYTLQGAIFHFGLHT
jgi:hypothetical protein